MKTMKNLRKKGRNALTKRRRSKKTKGGKRRRNQNKNKTKKKTIIKTIKNPRKRGRTFESEREAIDTEYDREMEKARVLYHNYNKRADDDKSIHHAGVKRMEEHKEREVDYQTAEKVFLEAENTLKEKSKALETKYNITGGVGPSDPSINYFNLYFGDDSGLESSANYPLIYFPTMIERIDHFNTKHPNSKGKKMLMDKIKRKIDETSDQVIINFISHLIGNVRNSNDKHDLLEHIRIN